MKKILAAGLFIFIGSLNLFAETQLNSFICNSNSYIFTSDQTANYTKALNIDIVNEKIYTAKESFASSHINAIGFNPKDGFIYGWEYTEGDKYSTYNPHIVKIDRNFYVKEVKLTGTLPSTRFYLGDVSQTGIFYLANRHQPENNSLLQEIQRVDLNTNTVLKKITLKQQNIYASDFAINPKDDMIYTVNALNNQLVKINPNDGNVTELGDVGIQKPYKVYDEQSGTYYTYYPAYGVYNYFDRDGNFYFQVNGDNVYKIDIEKSWDTKDKVKAKASYFKALTIANSGDGARCALAGISKETNIPNITISDASVVEGDSGTKNIVFKISSDIDIPYVEGLKLSYTLSDGSAKVGEDYKTYQEAFFMHGKSYTLSLPIIKGDTKVEADENFFIHFTAPISQENATFVNDTAKGTIIDNDKNQLDSYDITSSFTNRVIKTHIVNEPFNLKIVSIQPDNTKASSFTDIKNIQMKIVASVSCTNDATGLNMSGPVFSLTSQEQLSPSFKVEKAYKRARVQFVWEDAESGEKKASCSSDEFAVRPDKYEIIKPSSSKAGESLSIIVNAIGADGQPVANYLETKDTYTLTIDETKALTGCPLGTYTKSKHDFHTGQSLINLKYYDVGSLAFKVSEKHGSEFASVDSSDGSGDSRFISDGVDTITVDASQFAVNLSYTTLNSQSNYTYYSADPTIMGAKIKANVMVKDALGNSLNNFTKTCYAKDVTVSFDPLQTGAGTVDLQNPDKTPAMPLAGGRYSYTVSNTSFISNGEGSRELYLNFGRVTETPKLPVKMQLSNPSATIGLLSGTINPLNKTISFVYARAHGQDEQIGVGSNFVATIDYEAYLPSGVNPADYGLTLQGKGKDDLRWSILPLDTVFDYTFGSSPKLKFDKASITGATATTVSIGADKTPHTNILTYSTKPYLSSSQETSGIKIKMLSPTNQWSGKGKTGQIFDDSASREIKRRMEW